MNPRVPVVFYLKFWDINIGHFIHLYSKEDTLECLGVNIWFDIIMWQFLTQCGSRRCIKLWFNSMVYNWATTQPFCDFTLNDFFWNRHWFDILKKLSAMFLTSMHNMYNIFGSLFKSNRMSECLSVCVHRRNPLSTDPIWISFTM